MGDKLDDVEAGRLLARPRGEIPLQSRPDNVGLLPTAPSRHFFELSFLILFDAHADFDHDDQYNR